MNFVKQLSPYQHQTGIFFTADGIIVNSTNNNHQLEIGKTLEILNLTVNAVHIRNSNQIIIECTASISTTQIKALNYSICPIKTFISQSNITTQGKIINAYHWLNWNNRCKYCGQCGYALVSSIDIVEKKCAYCNTSFFPRFSPAVMVLICRGNEILLARSPHFETGVYSAIAGFIDAGETAEAAAHREVKEEVGIAITELKYFSSQTWPFPDSFMLAFTAKYLHGEISIDTNELEDAKWFTLDNLPILPTKASIARQLI